MSYLRDQRAGGDWRDVYLVLHLNITGHRPGDIYSHNPLFSSPPKNGKNIILKSPKKWEKHQTDDSILY